MEKIKLLLCCTKEKPNLLRIGKNPRFLLATDNVDAKEYHDDAQYWNGKIVAYCDYEMEELILYKKGTFTNIADYWDTPLSVKTKTLTEEQLVKRSCLKTAEICQKIEYNQGYAIYIKNLNIFDVPRKLDSLTEIDWGKNIESCIKTKGKCNWGYSPTSNKWIGCEKARVKNIPQNMMMVIDWNGEKAILISFEPEELCRILNGEQDIIIIVKRKVLKEML